MGRHKLNYKLKKPNKHHLYWRYVLITDPSQSEISTKTKVKYEAERIAKEAYAKTIQSLQAPITFGEYAADFFSDTCKLTARKRDSAKPVTKEMITMKRGQLLNYLLPQYKNTPLTDITAIKFEDWRQTLKLAKSTRNGITGTFKQILAEAVRDKKLLANPLQQVESLSKEPDNPRDSLSVDEMAKLFPVDDVEALKIWGSIKYHALMFLLVSSGMRSGEARALRWADVVWDDSGVLITKAMKITGKVGTVKEKKEKVVRLAQRTMQLLEQWKSEAKPANDDELIFWGKKREQAISRNAMLANFRRGLIIAGIDPTKNIVPHSLRHTFNTYSLTMLPRDVVQKFTGHSTEQMSNRYYHPILKQQLKATKEYQDTINEIWSGK